MLTMRLPLWFEYPVATVVNRAFRQFAPRFRSLNEFGAWYRTWLREIRIRPLRSAYVRSGDAFLGQDGMGHGSQAEISGHLERDEGAAGRAVACADGATVTAHDGGNEGQT